MPKESQQPSSSSFARGNTGRGAIEREKETRKRETSKAKCREENEGGSTGGSTLALRRQIVEQCLRSDVHMFAGSWVTFRKQDYSSPRSARLAAVRGPRL